MSMSSSSVIDFVSSSPVVHDETSNQSIEIPEPPNLIVVQNSTNNSILDNSNSSSNSTEEPLPVTITFDWVKERLSAGVDLRPILARILPHLSNEVSQSSLFELLDLFVPVQQRQPLEQYKTLDDAVELIHKCQNILVVTGAGISVSCGSKLFNVFHDKIFVNNV